MDVNLASVISHLGWLLLALILYAGYKGLRRRQAMDRTNDDVREREAAERERRQWQKTLGEFKHKFRQIGLTDLWETMEADFAVHINDVGGSTPSHQLFTAREKEIRIATRLEELQEKFRERMQRLVNDRRSWLKYFRALSVEELEQLMVNDGRASQWKREHKLHLKKTEEIRNASYSELFSERDRGPRMRPTVRSLRRRFKKTAKKKATSIPVSTNCGKVCLPMSSMISSMY